MVCHSSLPLRTTRTAVFYSTAQDTNTANAKREVIHRMLYPPMSVTDHHPLEHGTPTLDVLFSVPFLLHRPMKPLNMHGNSINATFARNGMPSSSASLSACARRWQSWKKSTLFYSRRQTREDLRVRSLVEMEVLKDKPSAEKRAIKSRIRGLFPTKLKVPTNTPSQEGWQHEWRPFDRPLH